MKMRWVIPVMVLLAGAVWAAAPKEAPAPTTSATPWGYEPGHLWTPVPGMPPQPTAMWTPPAEKPPPQSKQPGAVGTFRMPEDAYKIAPSPMPPPPGELNPPPAANSTPPSTK